MPKYILKEMPDMQGDGKRKIYPKLDAFRLLDTEDFVKEIVQFIIAEIVCLLLVTFIPAISMCVPWLIFGSGA